MSYRLPASISIFILSFGVVGLCGCGQAYQAALTENHAPSAANSNIRETASTSKPAPSSAVSVPHDSTASAAPHGGFGAQNIDMLSPAVGWAWSQDALWWTKDGGKHWTSETPSSLSRQSALTVDIVSKNVAWAAVSTNLRQQPPFPVWVTMTHGTQWNMASSPPHNDGISLISSSSAKTAWVATNMGAASGIESMVLDATVDGGKTWTMLPSSVTSLVAEHPNQNSPKSAHPIPLFGDKGGVVFASPKEGFITGGYTGQAEENAMLWRSVDGGKNWRQISLAAPHGAILNWTFAPTFFNADDGVMAVEVNINELATYSTHDGGRTWTSGQLLPWATQIGSPRWSFVNADAGLALSLKTNDHVSIIGATLYATSNGGRSWRSLSAKHLPLRHVKALDDVSATTAFALIGDHGRSAVWESQDGGRTWKALGSS